MKKEFELIRKKYEGREILKIHRDGELEYLTFPLLEKAGCAAHLFSTRLGGVSRNHLESMNLSYARGDDEKNVDENFRRITAVLGTTPEKLVVTDQTHTVNILTVGAEDAGKGRIKPRDYKDIDGLVTNTRGIVLSAFFADCVPLFFVDPVREVIGLSHSGWRGTAGEIGRKTVERMTEEFLCKPEDILAAIGPSICQDCYEIGEDVAEQFRELFPDTDESILKPKGDGKYLLGLWEANRRILLGAGILPQHLEITDLCTCCNPEYLFSHRASRGKRGNLGAFLMLKD